MLGKLCCVVHYHAALPLITLLVPLRHAHCRQEAIERAARAERERAERLAAEAAAREAEAARKAAEKAALRAAQTLLPLSLAGFAASRPAPWGAVTDEPAPQPARLQVELCMSVAADSDRGGAAGAASGAAAVADGSGLHAFCSTWNYATPDDAVDEAIAIAGEVLGLRRVS